VRLGSGQETLPMLVRTYLDRALSAGGRVPYRVRLAQVGQMWQKPGARPQAFTATEELAVSEVAFSWRARFSLLPLVSLNVVDEFAAGNGSLEARVFRLLPVMRRQGPELSLGEALRYLAELPWVPHAMLHNSELEWTGIDDSHVEVATQVGATRAAVRLEFDPAGDIVGAFSDQRPRPESNNRPTRWAGAFTDYATTGGIRIPTRAEVRWELPDGPFIYWRGTVLSLEVR
jgi:hypothetical protein